MIKEIIPTGFILILVSLITVTVNCYGQQQVQNNLPLSESEEKILMEQDDLNAEMQLNSQQQKLKKTSKSQNELANIGRKDGGEPSESNNEKHKNSILKTSSSLVTVFYVLVSYLFSGTLDGPHSSNNSL
jgi:hypothetical protein